MGGDKEKISPNPNMGTILESPRVPKVRHVDGEDDGDDEEEDDDGMDFFQMLAADPQTSAPAPRHITLPDTVAPLAFPPALISPTTETPSVTTTATAVSTASPHTEAKVPMTNLSRKFTRHATMLSFAGSKQAKESVDISQGPTQTFFDFVNMNGLKPLTELSAREAWWPVLFGKSQMTL
jgi:hypothetical protein